MNLSTRRRFDAAGLDESSALDGRLRGGDAGGLAPLSCLARGGGGTSATTGSASTAGRSTDFTSAAGGEGALSAAGLASTTGRGLGGAGSAGRRPRGVNARTSTTAASPETPIALATKGERRFGGGTSPRKGVGPVHEAVGAAGGPASLVAAATRGAVADMDEQGFLIVASSDRAKGTSGRMMARGGGSKRARGAAHSMATSSLWVSASDSGASLGRAATGYCRDDGGAGPAGCCPQVAVNAEVAPRWKSSVKGSSPLSTSAIGHNRCSRSRVRHAEMRRSRPGSMLRTRREASGISADAILSITSCASPVKGRSPVSISKSTTPSDQISALASMSRSARACSGLMYDGEP